MTRPIVFLTDYGLRDEFVGICHGVIARIAPDALVIDLTHAIARQDVLRGALALSRAAAYLPADAVYCAVVDPGVGSERRPIAVRAASGALLVGPDNGLLSMLWEVLGGPEVAYEIASPGIVLSPMSKTFHGRDIFAPAAAHLASGTPVETLGASLDVAGLGTLELPGPMVAPGAIGARVTAVDGFGNVQLNVTTEHLRSAGIEGSLDVGGATIPFVGTFAELPEHALGAIVDSQGFVAFVVNRGSAAEILHLGDGSTVVLE
ncbi:MAG TPA: SAM-dependent chlorinase/fluorinase [Actinomycetota bacterium]|nr:SAM-dependent chlorinase/fluorinase [Actinomycetota bacterium]